MGISYLKQEHLHGESAENGDCLRAAVASILGFYSLDAVPHFCSAEAASSEAGWFAGYKRWLEQHGLTAVTVPYGDWVSWTLDNAFYLLIGPSPRFPQEPHVVVAYGAESTIVHDPHPDGTGLAQPNKHHGWTIDLILPLEPMRSVDWGRR